MYSIWPISFFFLNYNPLMHAAGDHLCKKSELSPTWMLQRISQFFKTFKVFIEHDTRKIEMDSRSSSIIKFKKRVYNYMESWYFASISPIFPFILIKSLFSRSENKIRRIYDNISLFLREEKKNYKRISKSLTWISERVALEWWLRRHTMSPVSP